MCVCVHVLVRECTCMCVCMVYICVSIATDCLWNILTHTTSLILIATLRNVTTIYSIFIYFPKRLELTYDYGHRYHQPIKL